MAFNPRKPSHLTQAQYDLILAIEQDLSFWPSDVPHKAITFLSGNELQLLTRLQKNHPTNIVLSQVQLIRVVNVDCQALICEWSHGCDPFNFPPLKDLISDINLLSVDFVLCNQAGVPKMAIELDGKEHSIDISAIEKWVLASTNDPSWDGKTLAKMPKQISLWYNDKIKENALKSAGLVFRRLKNSDLTNSTALNALDQEITKYVV